MKTWPWWKLGLKLLFSPRKLLAFRKLPHSFTQFEDWHRANLAKAKIVASLVGCQGVKDLCAQEVELMAHRKSVCKTAAEWFATYSKIAEHSEVIDLICRKYADQKRCHRDFSNQTAGLRCYCDEKNY